MRFVHDVVPQYDLTYSDVFMVPSLSAVPSRLDVDLTTPDGIGTTIPVVVANMTAVAGRRMAETVARRGGLTVLPQDIPLDVISANLRYQKSRHPIYETAITLGPTETVGAALNLIHKRAHGVLIVVDDERRPIGIFAERDAAGFDRFTQLQNVMTRDLVLVDWNAGLEEIFELLGEHRISAAPVVDGDGRLVGVVTRRGALRSTIYRPAVNARGELMSAVAVGISGTRPNARPPSPRWGSTSSSSTPRTGTRPGCFAPSRPSVAPLARCRSSPATSPRRRGPGT